MFDSKFFTSNREELLRNTKSSLLVIPAHQSMQRNGDNVYLFRQESNFWYLTGIDEPDCVLVIAKNETFVIVPKKHWAADMFDGAINTERLTATSGITQVLFEREGWQKLDVLLRKHKTVGILRPMQKRVFSIAPNPARAQLLAKLRRRSREIQFEDLRLTLARMRMVKQPAEIKAIQHAIDITIDSIKEVFDATWSSRYLKEYEIEADLVRGFRARGAIDEAFTTIVASGQNACTIHHIKNDGELKNGDLLLIDLGAEFANYSADVARTMPIGKGMNLRQQAVFDAVVDIQKFALGLLRPGQNYIEYEQKVEEYMGTKLVELGLIKRATRKNIRKFFPHRTSHMLGLDPHDAADYSQPLQENMVITVEPGIYIPEEGIGVRIEDDVLITKTGNKVLSAKLPVSKL